ncbi:hypothetical protein L7F22_067383 [Adiantum nelumboides]|nr:hypothetical protein [Adiantum nelumboides]
MDTSNPTSNPLPTVKTTSPILSAAQPPFVQPGLMASASIQSPAVSAMMHLQQLNLQQSLLLQQYALSQQTLSKAVKSPAEIAAARAAEISKQLEGTGASEKKLSERSKSRSSSKSLSHSSSKSKSKSRSPSRSPIKRRRGHSRSLSPIRYRRDYYSSYRSRDHYGYRGQNYRSYYRGSYNDYSRYRYGRDYDYHYRRRSRSRGRRRSRTLSGSPRGDRSKGRRRSPTVSPPQKKQSQTGSATDSRRGSLSPPVKVDRSRPRPVSEQSLSREARRSRSVVSGSVDESPASSSSRSESQEKSVSNHTAEKSPLTELSEESDRNQTAVSPKRTKKGLSAACQGGTESPSSPSRSRSDSLNNDRYANAINKATVKEKQGGSLNNHDDAPNSRGKKSVSDTEDSEARKFFSGHGRRGKKPTRSSDAISDDDGESDESIDDWRHDMEKVVKGKTITAKLEDDTGLEGLAKSNLSKTQLTERGSSLTVNAVDHDLKEELVVHGADFVEHENFPMAAGLFHAVSDEGHENIVTCDDKSFEHAVMLEKPTELTDGDDDTAKLAAEDLIFEGPQPANLADKERKAEGSHFAADFADAVAKKRHSLIADTKKGMEVSIAEDADGPVHHLDGQNRYEDKVRDRSRSRDSKKRGAGLKKHESRKNKYRRHRKRQKNDSTDEDSERLRKRHKRKHDHAHKERKKRRHKHRSRLSSAEDSSSKGKIEVRMSSGKRRKSSKKHKTKRDLSNSFTSIVYSSVYCGVSAGFMIMGGLPLTG